MRKPASFYFFKTKPIILKERYELWRGVADYSGFTTQERPRVEWMVFYYTVAQDNATLTAQHFDISRKTFYQWLKRLKDSRYDVCSPWLTNPKLLGIGETGRWLLSKKIE